MLTCISSLLGSITPKISRTYADEDLRDPRRTKISEIRANEDPADVLPLLSSWQTPRAM
jgi:hypothetical protein